MDISSIKGNDDVRPPRDAQSKPQVARDATSAQSSEVDVQAVQEGGVKAPSPAEEGRLRDATAERQTKDAHARLRQALTAFAKEARLPTNAKLSIEVDFPDGEHAQTHFLVRQRETGKILRRIPDDEAVDALRRISEQDGFLVDHRA